MMSITATVKTAAEEQAAICRLFAHSQRVLILWVLADREKSVSQIAQALNTSLQNTSQHLRRMKKSGIIVPRREAQTIYYHICRDALPELGWLLLKASPETVETIPVT